MEQRKRVLHRCHKQRLMGLPGEFQHFIHLYVSLQALPRAVLRLLRPAHCIHGAAANEPSTEHNRLLAPSFSFTLMFCATSRSEDLHREIAGHKKKKN